MKNLLLIFLLLAAPGIAHTEEAEIAKLCPLALIPPPPVAPVDLPEVTTKLEALQDSRGTRLWKNTPSTQATLREIFASTPQKTKLEQFYSLLLAIQNQIPENRLPVTISGEAILPVLLSAKVFRNPDFPKNIQAAILTSDGKQFTPRWQLKFAGAEQRFPINNGVGFASWDSGKCQHAKELVFYNGFSFKVRQARNSKNLVVDEFRNVALFGDFGAKKGPLDITLSYVDLEKVEFIAGTDEGKVTARVAEREFETNPHSKFFKLIGRLIPNTSRQRIDW